MPESVGLSRLLPVAIPAQASRSMGMLAVKGIAKRLPVRMAAPAVAKRASPNFFTKRPMSPPWMTTPMTPSMAKT